MNEQHTKGPWEIRESTNGHRALYPVGGRERIADIYCPLDGSPVQQYPNANAEFIVRACNAYETHLSILRDVAAWQRDVDNKSILADISYDLQTRIRAALARARGAA